MTLSSLRSLIPERFEQVNVTVIINIKCWLYAVEFELLHNPRLEWMQRRTLNINIFSPLCDYIFFRCLPCLNTLNTSLQCSADLRVDQTLKYGTVSCIAKFCNPLSIIVHPWCIEHGPDIHITLRLVNKYNSAVMLSSLTIKLFLTGI